MPRRRTGLHGGSVSSSLPEVGRGSGSVRQSARTGLSPPHGGMILGFNTLYHRCIDKSIVLRKRADFFEITQGFRLCSFTSRQIDGLSGEAVEFCMGGTRVGGQGCRRGGGNQLFFPMPKILRSRGLSSGGDLTTTIFMMRHSFRGMFDISICGGG